MATPGIVIENLPDFQRALKAADGATASELTKALKAAGQPIVSQAMLTSARKTGRLAMGWRASVRGTTGKITNLAPYAGGAVWGSHRKWSGFSRYGPPGRFAAAALEDKVEEVSELLISGLDEILTIHGWAR